MLSPEIQTEILYLRFSKHLSTRAISKYLGCNRKSIQNVIKRGSVALAPKRGQRSSILDPHKERVVELLKEDPETKGMVILQRLRDEGYGGSMSILNQWIRIKRKEVFHKQREAFFKMDFAAGESAQVDWGEFGNVFGDGVKIHCFVMVLCYSRLMYLEFTRSEKFEEFIRCHENAIRYFNSLIPKECWYDNMPTVVARRVRKTVQFNPKFLSYCGHHHFMPHACNLARGNEKGRVENGVKYIKMNFWPSRKFENFEDLCRQSDTWRDQVANLREHRAIRRIPRFVFENEEKPHLQVANPAPYETDEVFSKGVRPDFHIVYETNHYSVPWTLVGCVVSVRVNTNGIKIYYQDHLVSEHSRSYSKHLLFTKPEHSRGLDVLKPRGANTHLDRQIEKLESYGSALKQYIDCLRYSPRSLKQEVSRVLGLGTIHGEKPLLEAIEHLLKKGVIGADHLENELSKGSKNLILPTSHDELLEEVSHPQTYSRDSRTA